jgi:hypothetical protein
MKSPKMFLVFLLVALVAGAAAYLTWKYASTPPVQNQMKDALGEKKLELENIDIKSTVKELKTSAASSEEMAVTPEGVPIGAVVVFDRKVATPYAKVYITVVAPYLNDPKRVDTIGGGGQRGVLQIRSRFNELNNFELKETAQNTGVYAGEIILTRETDKVRPHNGLLVQWSEDEVKALFKGPSGVVAEEDFLVRLNIGEIEIRAESSEEIALKVTDPDENQDPDKEDMLVVRLWSGSDPEGRFIQCMETEKDSGIFCKGTIRLSTKKPTRPLDDLYAPHGDIVVAEYVDSTLPSPFGATNTLKITGSLKR